jgi:hypothetical protein
MAAADSCSSPLHHIRLASKDDSRCGRRSIDDSKVAYSSLAAPGQTSELAEVEVLETVRLQKLFRNLRHQAYSHQPQVQESFSSGKDDIRKSFLRGNYLMTFMTWTDTVAMAWAQVS